MTAMCDVAFLLLTFFMLATKFKPEEPVVVKTPSSISEIPLPDKDIMLLTVDTKGRIFFSIDNGKMRQALIDDVNSDRNLNLTPAEKKSFALDASVLSPKNELATWIKSARNTNPQLRICIKADGEASYPNVQKIIKTLEGWHLFKFNLITNLKAVPPGTAAFAAKNEKK